MARSPNLPLLQKHMPELDVLRGCAILAVLFYHGLYWSGATSSNRLASLFIKATVVGWLGVNLFFVLSGFLITGILLDTKGRPSYYRKYFLRRALRILPAYLALVVILLFAGWFHVKSALLSLLFIANYDYLFHVGGYGPLWSLSVEEQFYLAWPAVVAKVSERTLFYICLALCFIEPLLRWLNATGRVPLGQSHTATYLIADNLALGALAALFARSRYGVLRNGIKLGSALCAAGLILFAIGYPFGILHRTNVIGDSFQAIPWNLFFTGLLLLLLGLRSPLATSIWAAPLRFFGSISYGLYLIHFLLFVRYDDNIFRVHNASLRQVLQNSFVRFFLVGGLSVLIAWFSRTFYEERFLQIGRRPKQAEKSSSESEIPLKPSPSLSTIATTESSSG